MGAKSVTVDFSGVKDRGEYNPKQVPSGDYAATITKVDDKPTKEGKPMYTFTVKLKKYSQNSYPYRCVVQENQLWKLRNIAVAAGINVPKKRMKFDPNKLINKTIGVTMEDDEYTNDAGKTMVKSEVSAVFPVSELADGAEIDDTDDDAFDQDSAPEVAGEEDDAAEDEAAESKPKKKKKDKAQAEPEAAAEEPKKKKKKKGKKKDDGELEELDISDV